MILQNTQSIQPIEYVYLIVHPIVGANFQE